jgi:predicted RNase H-like HicB family nuclease
MKAYAVVITRENGNWLADVPEVAGAHTFARSLPSLLDSVREVVILMADLPDDDEVRLDCQYDVEDALVMAAASLGQRRRRLDTASAELIAETALMARDLVAHNVSTRDAAELLDITPGRVSQLANA